MTRDEFFRSNTTYQDFVQHNLLGHGGEHDGGHNQSATVDTGLEMMVVTTLRRSES